MNLEHEINDDVKESNIPIFSFLPITETYFIIEIRYDKNLITMTLYPNYLFIQFFNGINQIDQKFRLEDIEINTGTGCFSIVNTKDRVEHFCMINVNMKQENIGKLYDKINEYKKTYSKEETYGY